MTSRVGIYDPYLDTLGGGERYCLTLANILAERGFQVDIFWSGDNDILARAESRFGIKLSQLHLVPDIFGAHPASVSLADENRSALKYLTSKHVPRPKLIKKITQFFHKYSVTKQYDYLFYLGDGSLPFLFGRHNYLHVQAPSTSKARLHTGLLDSLKLLRIDRIVCNSKFTQGFTSRLYSSYKCLVLYPPVDTSVFHPAPHKKMQILSVGRFDNIMNAKKQDIMIEAFKEMIDSNRLQNWRLILAGGSIGNPSQNHYLIHLQRIASSYPIDFLVNPAFSALKTTYEESTLYWHAAGHEVEETIHPESTEHFGMSVVESMASGCVPLVVNKGGLPEIVTSNLDGFLWNTTTELISQSMLLINSPDTLSRLRHEAESTSQQFSLDQFSRRINQLFTL